MPPTRAVELTRDVEAELKSFVDNNIDVQLQHDAEKVIPLSIGDSMITKVQGYYMYSTTMYCCWNGDTLRHHTVTRDSHCCHKWC